MSNLSKTWAVLLLAGSLLGPASSAAQTGTLRSPAGVKGFYLPYDRFTFPYEFSGIKSEVSLTNATGAYVLLVWDDPSVEADTTVWTGYRVRRTIPNISPVPLAPGTPNGQVVGQYKSRDKVTALCLDQARHCDTNYYLFGIGSGYFFKGFRNNRRVDASGNVSYLIDYPSAAAPADSCPTCRVFIDLSNLSGFRSRYAVTSIDTTSGQYEEFPESDVNEIVEILPASRPHDNLERILVVPNPYKGSAEWDLPGQRGVHFVHLPDAATVRIYTSSLELVREMQHDSRSNPGGVTGELLWNLRNANDREVETGIYIYQVETPEGRTREGHFVIIK